MTLNCQGTLIDLTTPRIMGIVNVTPDSFYSKSRTSKNQLVEKVSQMLEQGADFIDVGGYSTRPGAQSVSEEEETHRILSALDILLKTFPNIKISVDTFRSSVAQRSLDMGACLINDISAGNMDFKMWQVISDYQVPYIVMHMRGTPQTMMEHTHYENMMLEMVSYFSNCKQKAQEYGINDLIIDPGFGFSKTLKQNYDLLQNLDYLHCLDSPLLAGLSRKSMFYKLLKITPEKALNATTSAHTIALLKGAHILRVHDVQPAMEVIKIIQQIHQNDKISIYKEVLKSVR